MSLVNGFLVVSSLLPPSVYRGMDRAPWIDVFDLHYEGRLTSDAERALVELQKDSVNQSGLLTTAARFETANVLAQGCRTQGRHVEVVGIYSKYLLDRRDAVEIPEAKFIGYDVVSLGEWSLIRVVLQDSNGQYASDIQGVLNAQGLIDSTELEWFIVGTHRRLVLTGSVEEVAGEDSGIPIETIPVYLLATS